MQITVKSDITHNIFYWTVRKLATVGECWLGKKFCTGFETWEWNSIFTVEWTIQTKLAMKGLQNQYQTVCKKDPKSSYLGVNK